MRIIINAEVLSKRQGVWAFLACFLRPEVLHWEDEPLEYLAMKTKGRHFWEKQRAVWNKHPLLNDTAKVSLAPPCRAEAVIRTEPVSEQLADLGEPPRKIGDKGDSSWREIQAEAMLGGSFYCEETDSGKHHFGILPGAP